MPQLGGKGLLFPPGGLGEAHLPAGDRQGGQDGDEEQDDAHAAKPLGERAPEKESEESEVAL